MHSLITVLLLGASNSIALFVAVQLITYAILDHFGLFGIVTPMKILGIIVLIIEVKLILLILEEGFFER